MTDAMERALVRVCVGAAVCLSAYAATTSFRARRTPENAAVQTLLAFADSGVRIGRKDAVRSIYLVTDHQCPYCRTLHDSLRTLLASRPELFNIRVISFPLDAHPSAELGERALRCAATLGDATVADSALYSLGDSVEHLPLPALAARLGIATTRTAAFSECSAHPATSQAVRHGSSLAVNAGVRGTPTFWIDGRRFDGVAPTDTILAALQQ
jgi:protein-disulfide isomerase